MDCILEKEQSNLLLLSSLSTLTSSLYCFYRGYALMASIPFAIYVTSVMYWWHPDYSWRRYLDIGLVNTLVPLHHIIVIRYGYELLVPYCFLCAGGFLSFLYGLILFNAGHKWPSTIAHAGLHILTNLGILVVYSGRV